MQFNGYSSNWILLSLKAGSANDLVPDYPRKELLEYLNSPWAAPGDGEWELDPIKWWRVCILRLMRPTFTKLHLSIIRSSTQYCHNLHRIIWPSKALLWPLKDHFQAVASQILCTETYGSIPVWESADPQTCLQISLDRCMY